jgi:Dna[CI] antecedent, DciA
MFKKIDFKGLNYKELERYDSHDLKRENLHAFYQTFDFIELVEKWPQIIGPALSKVTSPLKIKGDSLIIMSKHASYSQNISFLSEEIKQKVFSLFPQLKPIIKKLNFQTQESYFNQKENREEATKTLAPKFHPQDPRFKVLKVEAERLFQNVEDEELKKLLTSIYIQSR